MAKKNQRDPNLRATTVARVHQLVKGGLTKAGAFEKISAETGRAKDAVQMLYYRAMRAAKGGSKAPASKATGPTAAKKASRRRSRPAAARGKSKSVIQTGDFPALLNGIAAAINALLQHVEKTVQENETLKEQADRLKAITSLVRGR